ncbi:choice-of-anchor M domain-containing protein [Actinoplanes sp. TRM 88003]|uniref:Choice-of-anchor M domain-containing protein n=1 Tax=Paractinoplanes aksuensis TaxID=2939490 RepID=A0ABT1E3S1_9ACTN|nr:choice-of-anchor M domain-containing protein [Actinoplanes aksuensis]MCO8277788.1 choice-of-anchor M domain-containing protein [Actinoplanes aksuensis]
MINALLALTLAVAPTPSGGLDQTLDAGQSQATGRAVLETGHVDIGPRLRDGKWTIQIHDDHAVPSVWREPDDTVLRIRDTARQPVPDDEAYAFLGEKPGTEVHVVPQTEKPGVVWIGWNTQDPGVLKAIVRGVTMSLRGVQGPGRVTVFLQSGNLGAPQVLWSSAKPYPQPMWVETNTHTHANWVFGRPGNYQVAVDISADLADGSTATASTVLRLAVGDSAEPDFDAAFTAPLPSASIAAVAEPAAPTRNGVVVLAGAGLLAVLVVVILVLRQAGVRRRAEREAAR